VSSLALSRKPILCLRVVGLHGWSEVNCNDSHADHELQWYLVDQRSSTWGKIGMYKAQPEKDSTIQNMMQSFLFVLSHNLDASKEFSMQTMTWVA